MAREYTLAGAVLFNGARDTDNGIWIRIRDENDRRILASAVGKQLKNQQAAIGTLTALDSNAGHLVDYIADALNRIIDGINGARPASAQLEGTPMGDATKSAATNDAAAALEKGAKRVRGKKAASAAKSAAKRTGGGPTSVGDVLASSGAAGAVEWADSVPMPRPKAGDAVRVPEGQQSSVVTPVGFDADSSAFKIVDSDGWEGLVYHHGPSNEWRVLHRALDYAADADASSDGVESFPSDALEDDDSARDAADDARVEHARESDEHTSTDAGGEQRVETDAPAPTTSKPDALKKRLRASRASGATSAKKSTSKPASKTVAKPSNGKKRR